MTYLASALVTVYSNHRMLGMRLVSRIKKNSEMGLKVEKVVESGEIRFVLYPILIRIQKQNNPNT